MYAYRALNNKRERDQRGGLILKEWVTLIVDQNNCCKNKRP